MKSVSVNDLKPVTLPLQEELRLAMNEVLESCRFLEGPQAAAFEADFASYVGCDHAVAVGNGTDALELALRAAGVTNQDEVITVANAGGYTTTACIAIGATPHYADIDVESLLLDLDRLAECLNNRTRAVVVTHLYGRMVDVSRVRDIVGPGVVVVEDCAQAHGATLHGHRAGSLGDFAAFSFYPTKNLGALGDAGMVLARDSVHERLLRALKQYGWSARYEVTVRNGRNTRMDELQAAVLRVKLPYLARWNAERRGIAAAYNAPLSGTQAATFTGNHDGNVHHLYVIRHPDRERVRQELLALGVASTVHYPVLDCDQPGLVGSSMVSADLRNSRRAVKEVLSLPCYPGMTPHEVTQVVSALEQVVTP